MIEKKNAPTVASENGSSTILRRGDIETPVFFMDESEQREPTPEEKELLKKFEDAGKLYKEVSTKGSTFNFQITKEAFDRLQGREGMVTETGKSRLLEILEEPSQGKPRQAKATYHLIVSPYTNVSEISRSEYKAEKALTFTVRGLSLWSWKINFELAQISKDTVSDIEERSSVYPEDLIKIETIDVKDANELIGYRQESQEENIHIEDEIDSEMLFYPQKKFQKKEGSAAEEQLGMIDLIQKDFAGYVGAGVYGMWENMRAMRFDGAGIANQYEPGDFVRTTEGIRKLFDQNTGDGTIVALGFLAMEGLLLSVDNVSKKLGKRGFDPTIRFLSSLVFGVGLASYLETTTFMNNTIDLPGDLFGVGLGAAAILTSKLMADLAREHITEESLNKFFVNTVASFEETSQKIDKLIFKIEQTLGSDNLDTGQKENIITDGVVDTLQDLDIDLPL